MLAPVTSSTAPATNHHVSRCSFAGARIPSKFIFVIFESSVTTTTTPSTLQWPSSASSKLQILKILHFNFFTLVDIFVRFLSTLSSTLSQPIGFQPLGYGTTRRCSSQNLKAQKVPRQKLFHRCNTSHLPFHHPITHCFFLFLFSFSFFPAHLPTRRHGTLHSHPFVMLLHVGTLFWLACVRETSTRTSSPYQHRDPCPLGTHTVPPTVSPHRYRYTAHYFYYYLLY